MRIVNLHDFLPADKGTLFAEYSANEIGELRIKGDSLARRQFYFVSLASQIDADDSDDLDVSTEDFALDHSEWQLSPVYDDHQRFVIYSEHDLQKMGNLMRQQLPASAAGPVPTQQAQPSLTEHQVEHTDKVFTID